VRLGTTLPWSDRTLLYVKGGGAVASENVSVSCIFGANNLNVPSPFGVVPASRCLNSNNVFTSGGDASQTIWGGMVGFGAEFGLTREWSAKAELNYIWFGNRDGTASDAARLGIGAAIAEAKIGLNYRFRPGRRPRSGGGHAAASGASGNLHLERRLCRGQSRWWLEAAGGFRDRSTPLHGFNDAPKWRYVLAVRG
jgi:Outer membrane protein beta-barrel domain